MTRDELCALVKSTLPAHCGEVKVFTEDGMVALRYASVDAYFVRVVIDNGEFYEVLYQAPGRTADECFARIAAAATASTSEPHPPE